MANKTGLFAKRVVAIGSEATRGTAATLTGTDAAINIFNAAISKDIQFSDRRSQVSMSRIKGIPGARGGGLTFDTDIQCDGSGAPIAKLAEILTHAGLVKDDEDETYTPISDPESMKAATLTMWLSDLMKEGLYGAMCNLNLTAQAGAAAVLNVEYKGVYVAPTAGTIPAITFPAANPLMCVSAAASYNAKTSPTLIIGNIGFKLQNSVALIPDVSSDLGYHSGLVTDRNPQLTFTAQARELSDIDFVNDWLAATERAFSFKLQNATDIATFTFPKLQIINAEPTDVEGVTNFNITAQCNQTSGDDEFSIAFTAVE